MSYLIIGLFIGTALSVGNLCFIWTTKSEYFATQRTEIAHVWRTQPRQYIKGVAIGWAGQVLLWPLALVASYVGSMAIRRILRQEAKDAVIASSANVVAIR